MRVTRLDECGRFPAPGTPDSVVVTDGFISVKMTTEVEEGTEIVQKNANGDICVNEKNPNAFKRVTLEIEMCGVNDAVATLMTNAEVYENWDEAGIGTVESAVPIDGVFAFELWTGLAGAKCGEGAATASGYILLPFVQAGTLGDVTVDSENAVNFTATGMYTRDGSGWGSGPYDVILQEPEADEDPVAGPLPSPLTEKDHRLRITVDVAPPPSMAGLQAMPA